MAEEFDPTTQQNFPTSAKPVFLRLGLLIAVLIAIMTYLYLDGRPEEAEDVPEDVQREIDELMRQRGEVDIRLNE